MSSRLQRLQQFLAEQPDDPFLLFALAKEYEKMNDDETALSYYTKLTSEHADYVGTYYHLGKLYERGERYEQATKTYERGMEVARQAGDMHARGELATAKMLLEEE